MDPSDGSYSTYDTTTKYNENVYSWDFPDPLENPDAHPSAVPVPYNCDSCVSDVTINKTSKGSCTNIKCESCCVIAYQQGAKCYWFDGSANSDNGYDARLGYCSAFKQD